MDTEEMWTVVATERRRLADLLGALTPAHWEQPSLCGGWRVRDVAAHVSMVALPPSPAAMAGAALRAKGSFHRLNHDAAVGRAQKPTDELVTGIREQAASRRLPVLTNDKNVLFDLLVHSQDIAIPLGIDHAMPVAAAAVGADRVWTMGWPFWAQRRLRGIRLVADDADWAAGTGLEARGPMAGLLLVLTGRPAGAGRLRGAGAEAIGQRLGLPVSP